MTKDEFQQQYHEYITQDESEATKEAKVSGQLDVGRVVPAHFPDMGWCLLLEESARALGTL